MRKGSKHTPESIKKIIANNARTGKKFIFTAEHIKNLSLANKGQTPWIKGKKQSPEHVMKRVEARIRNKTNSYFTAPRGENHYLWKKDRNSLARHDERNDMLYKEWRINVWKRDFFKCRINNKDCCGRIEAHHILGWTEHPELRYNINNGITLCHAHHPRIRAEEKRLIPFFMGLVTVSN
jgi:hypothetical protein